MAPDSSRSPRRLLPARPEPVDAGTDGGSKQVLSANDISALRSEIAADRLAWEMQQDLNRKVSTLFSQATNALQYGMPDIAQKARSEAQQLLQDDEAASPHTKGNRSFMLQGAYEECVKVDALRYFLETGEALRRASLGDRFEDEEYMSGMMSVCHELSHYALRRGTVMDTSSVEMCRNFISDVKAELLGFDFRNGPLRRKFDSIKYTERRCEDLLYELSFTESSDGSEKPATRQRHAGSVLDQEEWTRLREAYTEYDERREAVIKACRDVQKAAKQAIFAAHRHDCKQAAKLIATANTGVKSIWEAHVEKFPGLRHGSFAGALEELAEAELFLAWLQKLDTNKLPEQNIELLLPMRPSLACGLLKAQDYLGALSDFTGEVGRVAVEAATKRDVLAVRHCLRSVFATYRVLAEAALPGRADKKLDAAEKNFRKLETIEYDLAVRSNSKGPPPPIRSQQHDDADEVPDADARL